MGIPENALSTNDTHGTPKYILDPIVRCFGRIGLDPASHPDSIVESDTAILLPEYAPRTVKGAIRTHYANGLEIDWRGHGLIFGNFPYSDRAPTGSLSDFLDMTWRMRRDHGVETITLAPWRPGNVYWPKAAGKADVEVRLGRVTHVGSKTHAPFHSVLLLYTDRIREAFGLGCLGDVRIHPRHTQLIQRGPLK